MASIENINQEIDYVTVIDDTDDFVQILGVNQEDGDNEIEVSLVEIDGADSIIINVEDVDGYEDVNEFESYNDDSLNDDCVL
jgi:hypothetical protein